MCVKLWSMVTILLVGALGGCAQNAVPLNSAASEVVNSESIVTEDVNDWNTRGGSGRGGLDRDQNGARDSYGEAGANRADTNTSGYTQGRGASYDPYEAQRVAAERARQQAAQRAAAERARQQAAQRAAAERARQQAANTYGSGQYGGGGGIRGQYGSGGQTGQYGSGGDYNNNSAALAGAQNQSLQSGLLTKRIVYFDYDQSSIKPEYMAILDAHANYLRSRPNAQIRLEGHADDRGSREYNLALSERRSRAVRDYMAVKGAGSTQMNTVGYGEEMPVQFGQDEPSWSQNRRVEIKYTGE